MREFEIRSDGYHLDEGGHVITTYYVDLRHPAARRPITMLIKSGRREHAIGGGGTLLIATPQYYRERGEGPMWDDSEGRASRVTRESSVVDDPNDLDEARLDDRELNRAVRLVGSGINANSTTTSVSRSARTTDSITYAKKVWLFCTSIEPSSEAEVAAWRNAMDPVYDHASYIHRPREFARALAGMVAAQLGPQGQEATMTHRFGGLVEREPTRHKQQTVFHGPVIYVSDPYEMVTEASSDWERMLLSIFVKQERFAPEREYRFAVWSEDEPTPEPVILDTSLAMLGSLQERVAEGAHPVAPTTVPERALSGDKKITPVSSAPTRVDENPVPSPLDLVNDPGARIAPHPYSADELPGDLDQVVTTYSAVRALRHAVGNLEGARKVETASSAWHAEPCVRRLCAALEDPIRNVRVTKDNFIALAIKFPAGCRSEAELAFGPRGTSTASVRHERGESLSRSRNAWAGGSGMASVFEALEAAGARLRAI